ncbi:hypothetical protein HDV00_001349 [Rhizophlyctis rosea]|nr:hypothetical protein HDV00_001349 [Rhizophlyctis rosea]
MGSIGSAAGVALWDGDDDEEVDCVAVCKEQSGVMKVVAIDDMYIWTATNSSSINRWRDIPLQSFSTILPYSYDAVHHHHDPDTVVIPPKAVIRPAPTVLDDAVSLRSYRFSLASGETGRASFQVGGEEDDDDEEDEEVEVVWKEADGVVAGTTGITKMHMLNDRRRVVIEKGDVVSVWDVIKCQKVGHYPGAEFDEIVEQEQTKEWVANWCGIEKRGGSLYVHLEENKCTDGEMYLEDTGTGIEIKPWTEDQRVILSKWLLTYLLLPMAESFKRDMCGASPPSDDDTTPLGAGRDQPQQIDLPARGLGPGGMQSPAISEAPPAAEDDTDGEGAGEKAVPPFGFDRKDGAAGGEGGGDAETSTEGGEGGSQTGSSSVGDGVAGEKGGDTESREKSPESTQSSETSPAIQQPRPLPARSFSLPHFAGQPAASEHMQPPPPPREEDRSVTPKARPPLIKPNYDEAPPLSIPPNIPVIFSVEESPEAYGFCDLYRGTVASMGEDGELEKIKASIPVWVYGWIVEGNPPPRDTSKMSFLLQAHPGSDLPELPGGNNRLSANRMLRIRKLLAYVAEKLDIPIPGAESAAEGDGEEGRHQRAGSTNPDAKPEKVLEMLCCDKVRCLIILSLSRA